MVERWLVETDLSDKWDFYTRANVGEVFPDPVAPLSLSYIQNDGMPGPTEKGFRRAQAERERLGAEIAGLLDDDPENQGQFVAALHAATVFMPGRERTKTNCVKLSQEGRMGSHELGRRRVAAGHFDHDTNFALLTRSELEQEVDNPGMFSAE